MKNQKTHKWQGGEMFVRVLTSTAHLIVQLVWPILPWRRESRKHESERENEDRKRELVHLADRQLR